MAYLRVSMVSKWMRKQDSIEPALFLCDLCGRRPRRIHSGNFCSVQRLGLEPALDWRYAFATEGLPLDAEHLLDLLDAAD